ncbi:MAG: hypothetical protein JWR37_3213 [Mycobacterium sp.]|nr:hypothetical protein [Mycobacterium sp.]
MSVIGKAAIAAAGAIMSTMFLAAPASADPATNPCELAVTFLCRFMPIAPELDHNIDLTQDSAVINGEQLPQAPGEDSGLPAAPPMPICINGCY